jgi:hypothetical protein
LYPRPKPVNYSLNACNGQFQWATFFDFGPVRAEPHHFQEVKMPPSLLFLDEDLGSLHFLFIIFYFFLNYAWVLSKSKLITLLFRQVHDVYNMPALALPKPDYR